MERKGREEMKEVEGKGHTGTSFPHFEPCILYIMRSQ